MHIAKLWCNSNSHIRSVKWSRDIFKESIFLCHMSLMELFDIRLDGEEIEASPDFDDLPANPPNK